VDEKFLALLVAHDLSEPAQLILIELLLTIPGLEQYLIYVFLKAAVEVSLQTLLIGKF
jgi:hypothetical protein